jgi:hypothetical protein
MKTEILGDPATRVCGRRAPARAPHSRPPFATEDNASGLCAAKFVPDPRPGRGRRRRIGGAEMSAAGLVGGLAAAEEAAEGFKAGGRVVRCRPLVEGAAG